MKNIINSIEDEISLNKSSQKGVNISLIKDSDKYKGLSIKQLEGDYLLSFDNNMIQVQVEWNNQEVLISGR